MRTHHTCHLTVPSPALSPTLTLHTSTPPTTTAGQLPDSFCPQHSLQLQQIRTILSRMHFLRLKALTPSMNNTLATNTRANRSLRHEPKTHSPHLRQLSFHLALTRPPRTGPGLARTTQSGAPCCPCRPMRARDTSTTASFPYVQSRLPLGMFSHFAP